MMCTLRIFVSWQRHYTPERHSWLAGPKNPPELSAMRRFVEGLTLVNVARSPINTFHWLLIVANVLIITGGSLLGGGTNDARDNWTENSDLISTSKGLRGAGQAMFLCLTIFIFLCIFYTLYAASKPNASSDERKNRAILIVIACSFPFMITRGVFGLLQALLNSLNYYNPDAYNATGFTDEWVVKEVCCATMCEWFTATLLLSTSLLKGGTKNNKIDRVASDGTNGVEKHDRGQEVA